MYRTQDRRIDQQLNRPMSDDSCLQTTYLELIRKFERSENPLLQSFRGRLLLESEASKARSAATWSTDYEFPQMEAANPCPAEACPRDDSTAQPTSPDSNSSAPHPGQHSTPHPGQHSGPHAQENLQNLINPQPSGVEPLASLRRTLATRANHLQMLLHPKQTRLLPPADGHRIYSDDEIDVATTMFHKLKHGEDRRPYPRPPTCNWMTVDDSITTVDPLDRVADVLLDLFDL